MEDECAKRTLRGRTTSDHGAGRGRHRRRDFIRLPGGYGLSPSRVSRRWRTACGRCRGAEAHRVRVRLACWTTGPRRAPAGGPNLSCPARERPRSRIATVPAAPLAHGASAAPCCPPGRDHRRLPVGSGSRADQCSPRLGSETGRPGHRRRVPAAVRKLDVAQWRIQHHRRLRHACSNGGSQWPCRHPGLQRAIQGGGLHEYDGRPGPYRDDVYRYRHGRGHPLAGRRQGRRRLRGFLRRRLGQQLTQKPDRGEHFHQLG